MTPERLCYVNCGMPLDECKCYRENYLHGPKPDETFLPPQGYVPEVIHNAVVAERDEADRRAGAAERELGWLKNERTKHSLWRSKAKQRAGYDDNVSFDRVFEDLLAAKEKLTELEKHRA